jgi:hypothetical protein
VSVDPPPSPFGGRSTWEEYWADRGPGPLSRLPRPVQVLIAAFISLCGGLALIYFLFAAIGQVDLAQSETTTIIASAMALIWFVAFLLRLRTGALRVQRADRERRGY